MILNLISGSKLYRNGGLWETWNDKDDGSVYKSCTIITTSASESIIELHNRMPVILKPEVYEKWLDVEIQDLKELQIIINDYLNHAMKYYPVSTFVNDVKNNDPNCIKHVEL